LIFLKFYTYGALASNEFTGHSYDCQACSGDTILRNLSFTPGWYTVPVYALLGFVVVFNFGAMVMLSFVRFTPPIAGLHRLHEDPGTVLPDRHQSLHMQSDPIRASLSLINTNLTLKPISFRKSSYPIPILQNITTHFSSAQVNVIMGPSGSGKSSLLRMITGRLPRSNGLFSLSGRTTINGHRAQIEDVRALCSFMTQDDSALLPYLTVREMLNFSARLCLPEAIPGAAKRGRVEELIRLLGLADCADYMIGNDNIKGISGGEKRRVSIATRLLTDPKILV
jgi:ABC-type lipoprotein export system ATPase subunit